MDPCVITPYGAVVPLRVIDGVPCLESNDFRINCRDHFTNCSELCGVIVRDGCVEISVKLDCLGTVACPGTHQPEPLGASSSAEGTRQGEAVQVAPRGASSDDSKQPVRITVGMLDSKDEYKFAEPCTAEVASDSEGSLGDFDSTEALGTNVDDLDGYSSDESVPVQRNLWDVARSDSHQLSHKPALPNHCHPCMIAKAKRICRASKKSKREAKCFGDSITCDHVFMKDWLGCEGVDGVPDVLNVMDLATRTWYSCPVTFKDALDTFTALNKMKGRAKIKHVYSDIFSSIRKTVKLMGINWEACQPGVHHSNAIIERCNQELLNDCRVALFQAGLPACFWTYGSPYVSHIHNITLDPEDGKSPWFLRYNKHFKGKGIPCGCGVWFLPAPTKFTNSKAAPERSYGIFLGYRLQPGGLWNGEDLVADLDDFVNANLDWDAPGSDFRIYPHITERVDLGKQGVCFPCKPACERASGTLKGREDSAEIREDGPFYSSYDEFGAPKKYLFSKHDSKQAQEAEGDDTEAGPRGGLQDDNQARAEEPVGGSTAAADSSSPPDPIADVTTEVPEVPKPLPKEEVKEHKWFYDAANRRYPADDNGRRYIGLEDLNTFYNMNGAVPNLL